jgi:hypothetical protein
MSNRLGGKQGTAYLGTNANQPPNWTFSDRDPNQYDTQNVSLGDLWLNQDSEDVWVLVSLQGDFASKGSLATWTRLESGGISELNALTGNTGGVVNADSNANINVVGDGTSVTVTGDPATHTLTISATGGGGGANSFPTDSGTATPSAGVLNVVGGKGIIVSGASNTVTVASTGIFFTYIDVNSSPYTVLNDDVYLSVDSTGGPITILFPNSALLGEPFIVKDRTGTAATHNITITTVGGSVTIDGVTSFIMDSAYQSISLVGNGTSYEIY